MLPVLVDPPTIFILSDGTGETAAQMIRAALVQYEAQQVNIVRCKNVRTREQIDVILDDALRLRGLVVFTMVGPSLSQRVTDGAAALGLTAIDLMGPLLGALARHLGREEGRGLTAGLLRQTDDRYFRRIEAIEFTVKYDDGKTLDHLDQADIVLVGISRTSKTPLSIFLSHKGWKVANIPVVLDQALPTALFDIDQRRIVGLTIDPSSLTRIRQKRIEKIGADQGGRYASARHVHDELEYARILFKTNRRWPVFDVTDRALEETAAEIQRVVAARLGLPYAAIL